MAVYDPPQPLWKRNLAGILDFLLGLFGFGFLFSKLLGSQPAPPVILPNRVTVEMFSLTGWPALLTLIAIVVYFIVLGRTGGTVFQRLFGMKRA
jgi:RDD family